MSPAGNPGRHRGVGQHVTDGQDGHTDADAGNTYEHPFPQLDTSKNLAAEALS
jgi:hypothetical protein